MQFKERAPQEVLPENAPEPQPEKEDALAALRETNPEITAFTPVRKIREGEERVAGGVIFIDADKAAERHGVEPEKLTPVNVSEKGDVTSAFSKPATDFYAKIARPYLSSLGLTEREVRTVEIRPIGRRIIDAHVKNLVRAIKSRTEEDATRTEASENLADLLLGNPKDALNPLRRFLITRLMKQGAIGETIWQNLVTSATIKLNRLLGDEAKKIRLPHNLKDAQKFYTG